MTPDPLNDRVLVAPLEAKQSSGGILLPDNLKDKDQGSNCYVVVSISKAIPADELQGLAVGDHVWAAVYAGIKVETDTRREFRGLKLEDIVCVERHPGNRK